MSRTWPLVDLSPGWLCGAMKPNTLGHEERTGARDAHWPLVTLSWPPSVLNVCLSRLFHFSQPEPFKLHYAELNSPSSKCCPSMSTYTQLSVHNDQKAEAMHSSLAGCLDKLGMLVSPQREDSQFLALFSKDGPRGHVSFPSS